ncbi:MAG: alpha/beta fold hydrolase [bacterium]
MIWNTNILEFDSVSGVKLRGVLVEPKGAPDNLGVIFIHGFERAGTTERKFKALADALASQGISSLRLDFSGCGLSDGDYSFSTVEQMALDAIAAADAFKNHSTIKEFCLVGHSLGGCVIARMLESGFISKKNVLIAPALNQKALLRYYFVRNAMMKANPPIKIDWINYVDFLDEKTFLEQSKLGQWTKLTFVSGNYFVENLNRDYSSVFAQNNTITLLVHGDRDDKVPLQSHTIQFKNNIVVPGGDHDIEREDFLKIWLSRAVDFIISPGAAE